MEKISGILPSSPRVSAVDIKDSVRPGTPSFGRPEGNSSLRDAALPAETSRRSTGNPASTSADAPVGVQADWRTKEAKQAAVAAELSNKFFLKNRPEPVQARSEVGGSSSNLPVRAVQSPVDSQPAGFKTDESGMFRSASARPEIDFKAPARGADEESILQQPEGLYPRGFFLDRTA